MKALQEIFFLAIVFYLLYRFIFNFLLPVSRATRQVRQQFKNMQEGNMPGQQQPQPERKEHSSAKPPIGDYIDFEEIKD
jgi:lipopolysaccharide export LptBFGC system permease protein LptF